ncbi:MAG: GAF domain-containing protein [Lentimonas sp.]
MQKKLRISWHSLLEEGSAKLGLPVGIVSHAYNNLYQVVAINLRLGELILGATFPLNQTYCRDVFETDKTVAINEIDGVSGLRLHPLYVSMPLEAYIGTPIHHKGVVWGTANFSSPKCRSTFSADEIKLIKGYAQAIERRLDEIDPEPAGSEHRTHVASRAPFRGEG